jgi:hypothetical protein
MYITHGAMRSAITPDKPISCIAFLGAVCASNEVELLHALKDVGVTSNQIAFMDTCFSTTTIHNIQKYIDGIDNGQPRPVLLFSFQELGKFLQHEINRTAKQVVVIGINAGFTFIEPSELYDCHAFLCKCASWARIDSVHHNFMNFMGNNNHNKTSKSCLLAEKTWLYQCPWWEFDKEIMTNTSAEQLLVVR